MDMQRTGNRYKQNSDITIDEDLVPWNENTEDEEDYQQQVINLQMHFSDLIKKAGRDKEKKLSLFLKLKQALPSIDLREFAELLTSGEDNFETFENKSIADDIENAYENEFSKIKKKDDFVALAVSAVAAIAKGVIGTFSSRAANYAQHADQRTQLLLGLESLGYSWDHEKLDKVTDPSYGAATLRGTFKCSDLRDPFGDVVVGVKVTDNNNIYGVVNKSNFSFSLKNFVNLATGNIPALVNKPLPILKTITPQNVLTGNIPALFGTTAPKWAQIAGNIAIGNLKNADAIYQAGKDDFRGEANVDDITNAFLKKLDAKGLQYNSELVAAEELIRQKAMNLASINVIKGFGFMSLNEQEKLDTKKLQDANSVIDQKLKVLDTSLRTFEKVAKIPIDQQKSLDVEKAIADANPLSSKSNGLKSTSLTPSVEVEKKNTYTTLIVIAVIGVIIFLIWR